MLQTASERSCINRASVFERDERFKESRKYVRVDEKGERRTEINTPELIGQRFRVRVTIVRF